MRGKVAMKQTGLAMGTSVHPDSCLECQLAALLLPGLAETGHFLRQPGSGEEAAITGPGVHFSSHCVIKI